MSATRTIARNTTLQAVAEMLGKLASFAFYAIMARQLGQDGFGEFTFALSLALLTTIVAGFGIDPYVAREVARDRAAAPRLLLDAVVVKIVFGMAGVAAAVVVAVAGGYPARVVGAVALLALACVADLAGRAAKGAFQGLDDLRPVAASLVLQRYLTAALGIALLVLGFGLLAAAVAYLVGMLLALGLLFLRLAARGVRPAGPASLQRSKRLVRSTVALGVNLILNTALFRIDTVLLSFFKSDAAVGLYGVAYRLLETTLFLPYTFAAAMLATLSRLRRDTVPPIGDAAQLGYKLVALSMLPIGAVFVAFPAPIVHLAYGREYDPALDAVRLLGGAAALYGISYLSAYVLMGQGRQAVMPRITVVVLGFNVVANLLVIPRYSYEGAAAVTSASELLLATLSLFAVTRTVGRLSLVRVAAGPVAGCAVLGLAAVVLGTGWPGLVAGGAGYLTTVAAVEWKLFPADVRRLIGVVRGRGMA